MKSFSETTMVLTLSVMSTITPIETQYAATVLQKTYVAMLHNQLEVATDYCDPYCRDITYVTVMSANQTNIFAANTTGSSFARESTCDSELRLSFSLNGTFWACEDQPFPGLFSSGPNGTNLEDDFTMTAEARSFGYRFLEIFQAEEEEMCPSCPANSTSSVIPPSAMDLAEVMAPFVEVLPVICDLTSVEVLDDGSFIDL
mmetsp:Transcript_16806/g.27270  ORF Transcript_16806/g.27270 Transcript_16806/m.27270 type:complete len:201 (-) Transcript_16806:184-786(-)